MSEPIKSDIYDIDTPLSMDPDSAENQMVSLAMHEARKRILDGTASSQIICHFLALGSSKAQLEKEKIRRENDVLEAKSKSLQSEERIEKLISDAIEAMQTYSGQGDV